MWWKSDQTKEKCKKLGSPEYKHVDESKILYTKINEKSTFCLFKRYCVLDLLDITTVIDLYVKRSILKKGKSDTTIKYIVFNLIYNILSLTWKVYFNL